MPTNVPDPNDLANKKAPQEPPKPYPGDQSNIGYYLAAALVVAVVILFFALRH